jgi:enoyl-CoA hydratase/carnithine racemase
MALDYEVKDGIAYMSFARPDKLNALRDEDLGDLARAVLRFDHEDDAQVGILYGQGRAFSAGADLAARLQDATASGSTSERVNEGDAFNQGENWKPIIAAVHGYCLGHAMSTILACDLVVASRDAVFQITEITIGLPGTGMWRALAGKPGFANDVALTGRRFSAQEAWEAGIISRLVDNGEHITAAEELAREVMKNPQFAVREQVRIRRNLASEETARMRTAAGNAVRNWAKSSEAAERIAGKMANQG